MKRALPVIDLALGVGALLGGMWFAFAYAPVESQMGIVQKIFYFHVPAAYSMYLSWAVCTVASILYIVRKQDRFDALARSAGELALLYAIMVMITGPLWGRKSWGAFWVWDPRLTTALVLTMIIASYVLLRTFNKEPVAARFGAAIAIIGAAMIPLVHLSVYMWRGQHPVVLRNGGLSPKMLTALLACLGAFTAVFGLLLRWRYRLEVKRLALAAQQSEEVVS